MKIEWTKGTRTALSQQFGYSKEIFPQSDHEDIWVYPGRVWNCNKALSLSGNFTTIDSRHLCLLSNRAEHGGSVPPPARGFLSVFEFLIFRWRRKLKRTFWFSRYSNKSSVFHFHSMRRRFRVRGILIVTPIDFSVMVVISRFGLDEK